MSEMNIGEKIQEIRNGQNLTQEELAREANISYITLVKIEQGKIKNPTIKTLRKIAEALKVSIDTLAQHKSYEQKPTK